MPLLCPGITFYSPLRHWPAGPGKRVAILCFGGLGHVGVQIAIALGAHVTVFEAASGKRHGALRLETHAFQLTTGPDAFRALADSRDLIISTVPASLDLDGYLSPLRRDGTLVNLGVPEQPLRVSPVTLRRIRRSVAGSSTGSIAEMPVKFDFCAQHDIGAEVTIITADQIDEAHRRLFAGDVRYRFAIAISTMGAR